MLVIFAAVLLVGAWCAPAMAKPVLTPVGDRTDPTPPELQGVGVDEHLNAKLPLNLPFVDETGRPVQLKDYFKGKRPVILQLGYLQCPMLCGMVSQGTIAALKDLKLDMGKDYQFLFVSIDPNETPQLSYLKKQSYIKEYGKRGDADGWHFLTGTDDNIHDLAKAIGWKYKWVNTASEFAHPAVIMICTPDGRISRYLYGVKFPEQTLRLSLVEASDGKIGSTLDHILLTCCVFDPSTGKYTWAAMGLMRIAATITVLVLLAVMLRHWGRNRSARRSAGTDGESA